MNITIATNFDVQAQQEVEKTFNVTEDQAIKIINDLLDGKGYAERQQFLSLHGIN